MNFYLKSAVQNLDAHIMELTEIRNRLALGMSGGTPEARAEKEPVQTLEPASAKAAAPQDCGAKRQAPKQKRGGATRGK